MNPSTISLIVLACVCIGALMGAALRRLLPHHHLSADSKEIVRLATGLVGTMTALVLGLLVASAKASYDTDRGEVIQLSAKIIFIDRVLANYGPDAADARATLAQTVKATIDRMWPSERDQQVELAPMPSRDESLQVKILRFKPADDAQQTLKSQATSIASEIGQMRWLLYEQSGTSISTPFLVVVTLWLTVMFLSFGLFAPPNSTVVVTLLICALSVACAIFLVLELDHPFDGIIHISSDPMRNALAQLGQ